eukprot:TRINITY_DN3758_c0_g3_i1.p1 TRINITY_DN3758_c0_g3~~TRINITY_DN3758_c0_g3_i1.p1  ORF type:complete len:569 (+),score=106.21 TRINITY_DN3758_c0_g3_i1:375-2081(+)
MTTRVKSCDLYSVLIVEPNDSKEEICHNYKRLARYYHPDKHLDPDIKKLAQNRTADINMAYDVLSHEDTRVIYNHEGEDILTRRWEIDVRHESSEKVIEEFERKKLFDKLQRRMESLKQVGVFQTKLDATNIITNLLNNKSLWTSPASFPQLSSFGIAQGSNIEISPNTKLSLSVDMTNEKSNGFSPFVNVKDDFPSIRSLKKWTTKKNNNINVYVEGSRTFKQFVARAGANLATGDACIGVTKIFDRQTKGSVSYASGSVSGLIFSLYRVSDEGKSPLSIEMKIAQELYTSSFLKKRLPSLLVSKEFEVDKTTTLNASAKLNATGDSGLSLGFFHKVSKLNDVGMSVNISSELGVIVSADFKRGDFQINLPILFSPEITPIGVAAAFFFSSVVMLSTKFLFFGPMKAKKQARKIQALRKMNREAVLKARKKSEEEIRALTQTVVIKREQEEGNNGLIIMKAYYGKVVDPQTGEAISREVLQQSLEEGIVVDVSIPLQYYVNESKLLLESHSKAVLFGFYDPAIKEQKELFVQYLFGRSLHEVIISDEEELRLPLKSHTIKKGERPLF